MIVISVMLLYLATVLTISLIRGDYSFDGILYTMYYGYYKSGLIFGDSIAIIFFNYTLTNLGYRMSTLELIYLVAFLLTARLLFAYIFERRLISTSKEMIQINILSMLLMIVVVLFGNTVASATLASALFTIYLLGKQKIPNPYDEDFFAQIVVIYAHSLKYEIEMIDAIRTNDVMKRALKSILIMEVICRPKIFRKAENLLFKTGLVKSVGIMQVSGAIDLPDSRSSIMAAYKHLCNIKKVNPRLRDYAEYYNGKDYANIVLEIDEIQKYML